jgi:hypothetical protein
VITGTYSAKKEKKMNSPLFKDRNFARLSAYTIQATIQGS